MFAPLTWLRDLCDAHPAAIVALASTVVLGAFALVVGLYFHDRATHAGDGL